MLSPAYKITLGRTVIDTVDEPQASTVTDLTVSLDMDSPADIVTLLLGNVATLQSAQDDEISVELGYEDNGELIQVIVGTVVTIALEITTVNIIGYAAANKLLRTFVDQTYESKNAGQIVRDLASQAEVDVATAEDGITFSAYVIDSRRSIYHHMHDLAELSGFDLYINTDGDIIFKKFIGGETVHVFEYAKHVLKLDILRTPQQAGQVEAWGESPGGAQGGESWAWLTKDFGGSSGTAGSGTPKLLLERPALRDATAARTAATAAHATIQRQTLRGQLLSVGRPEVKLGDAIRLRDVPEDALNDVFQVRGVTHRLTKQAGFTTQIEFRSIA